METILTNFLAIMVFTFALIGFVSALCFLYVYFKNYKKIHYILVYAVFASIIVATILLSKFL